MRFKWFTAALLTGLCLGQAAGQTSAELLQKGIYTQDTVGDLDSAIKIYRQVVASASESRALGAQAQFRLATCLLKKGDRAGAVKAFEQLIQEYPEQKELVAQAREQLPAEAGLQPAPWSDGELTEYRIKLPAGMSIGSYVYSVEANPSRPQNLLLTSRAYVGGMPHQWSRVEVERDTMRPISISYSSQFVGEFRMDYEARQARMQPKGKDAKTIALDGAYWDNEEALWVMRRMPLAAGYKTKLPVLSPMGVPLKIDLTVQGIEEVQVKAGKFRCFKVELSVVKQLFYIAVDAPRQVVKMEANGVTIELENLRRVDSSPVAFRDPKTGLSLTAPAGWIFVNNPEAPGSETHVSMLDPNGRGFAALWANTEKIEAAQIASKLRDRVEEKMTARAKSMKEYKLRPATVQTRTVGGQQALSCAADYVENNLKMVEYLVWLRSENKEALFFSRVPAEEFEAFRARIDAIVDTAKLN